MDAPLADSPPTWQLRRANGRSVLVLAGDWVAQSGRIPEFPANSLGGPDADKTLAFDTARLGQWDSGLIAFLWDAKRVATTAGVAIDSRAMPDSARKLLGLLPESL